MSLELCDELIDMLTQCFGSPFVQGTFHRWVVALPRRTLDLIIGLDRCDKLPIILWTVDSNQSSASALRHYEIRDSQTAASTVEEILGYIRHFYPSPRPDDSIRR